MASGFRLRWRRLVLDYELNDPLLKLFLIVSIHKEGIMKIFLYQWKVNEYRMEWNYWNTVFLINWHYSTVFKNVILKFYIFIFENIFCFMISSCISLIPKYSFPERRKLLCCQFIKFRVLERAIKLGLVICSYSGSILWWQIVRVKKIYIIIKKKKRVKSSCMN